MPLEIIGAGFGRTGTLSLHHALEKLGYPTHHMIMVKNDPDQDVGVWNRAYDNPETHEDEWEKVYGKYRAAIDWPTAAFYEELSQCYPEAKVILTVRSPESWFKSMHKTSFPILLSDTTGFSQNTIDAFDMSRHVILEGLMEKDLEKIYDEAFMCRYFEEHIEKVKRTIPADRLLIYEIGSGWEPLCKFLGKDVPNEPYPSTNNQDSFEKTFETLTKT
ncbi:hypothetical protein [Absidia glauca]|uniref:Sulfotransferase domain-containing protein n=1 Tax=Absidia glauca TaxID=4829 RepID=A0A163M9B6_ABSGL|nr:hypothetical protein [Absidia glauca]